jgi:hypothetical protein
VGLAISEKKFSQRPLRRSSLTDAGEPHHSFVLTNSFIIVADYRKNSEHLGTNVSCPTLGDDIDDGRLIITYSGRPAFP